MNQKIILCVMAFFLFNQCKPSPDDPTLVMQVDLNRYAGLWYEIASFPASFQKDCQCTTAEYKTTDKGFIRVINRCRRGDAGAKQSEIHGKAFIVPASGNTKLQVQFFWPFRGDYHIIRLDQDYQWAVVASGNKYLWILCRNPQMDSALYDRIVAELSVDGYEMGRLQKTVQPCS